MSADLLPLLDATAQDAAAYADAARAAVKPRVSAAGKIDRNAIDAEQHVVHGLAWVATYAETLREVSDWARTLNAAGKFGEVEHLLAKLIAAEYGAQLAGGLPMTQVETIRPSDFGVEPPPVRVMISQAEKTRLAELVRDGRGRATLEKTGLDDDFELIRDQFRKFADAEVVPHAHEWHMKDELIPIEIVQHMGELGVFGLTIPEEFGGAGLGKTAMCVVSEELSRGYIGVGSLGTRSEIAAELILTGGTPEQKAQWLPKIATAEILPTAVFTEPNTGSDLASLKTRAAKNGADYVVTGNKTWITHAARAGIAWRRGPRSSWRLPDDGEPHFSVAIEHGMSFERTSRPCPCRLRARAREHLLEAPPRGSEHAALLIFPRLEVCVPALLFGSAAALDLLGRPVGGPPHLAARDPVVRLARQLPAPDRRRERRAIPSLDEGPLRGAQRRYHFVPASTRAEVSGYLELLRHVEDAGL